MRARNHRSTYTPNFIRFPTTSQGIAIFPEEADEIFCLIDLADRRLYIAKERGRNQIEPAESHWAYVAHQ